MKTVREKKDWREWMAWYLDEAFRVPGTNFRVGWDSLIGLIPGLGDWITGTLQAALVLSFLSKGDLPMSAAIRMVLNVILDNAVGAIPIVGDVFDFFFKANARNVRIMRRVDEEKRLTGRVSSRPHTLYLVCLGLGMVFAMVFVGYVAFMLAYWFVAFLAHALHVGA